MEDISYLKRSYEALLADDVQGYWLNDSHWVEHAPTNTAFVTPPKKKRKLEHESRVHVTGCARTEGFYKLDLREKRSQKVRRFILCLAQN